MKHILLTYTYRVSCFQKASNVLLLAPSTQEIFKEDEESIDILLEYQEGCKPRVPRNKSSAP